MRLKGLLYIAWGFVLTCLDLYIGPVDVLPDILGYVLIFFGVRGLAFFDYEETTRFGPAKGFAIALIVLSTFQQVGAFIFAGKESDQAQYIAIVLLSVGTIICLGFVFYFLSASLSILLEKEGLQSLSKQVRVCSFCYMTYYLLTNVVSGLRVVTNAWVGLVIELGLFILTGWLFLLLRNLNETLEPYFEK